MYQGVYNKTVEPVLEPITTDELKTHLKIDWVDEDTYLGTLIQVAREMCESFTGRSFYTQTHTVTLNEFPSGTLYLYKGRHQSITSVQYYDTNNDIQTLASSNYYYELNSKPAKLAFTDTADVFGDTFKAVIVTMVTGWDDVANIPQAIKHAILLQAAYLYENREAEQGKRTGIYGDKLYNTSELLLLPFKIMAL